MAEAYLSLGSNLGERIQNIEKAISLLKKRCTILNISSYYETEPVGFLDQNWFINCAIKIQTRLSPQELMEIISGIENSLGKKIVRKSGPRTIDIDILLYDDQIINKKGLIVPHPRFHARAFALVPLCEFAPDAMHPFLKKSVRELLSSLHSKKGIRKNPMTIPSS